SLRFSRNGRAPPASSPLSLHDALPICGRQFGEGGITAGPEGPSSRRPSPGRGPPRSPSWGSSDRGTPSSPSRRSRGGPLPGEGRSEEHTSELQSLTNLVCRLLLGKKKA